MKVFKFGGASIKDAAAIKNVAAIIERYKEEKLIIVISAIGKTTNALEKIVAAYFYKKPAAKQLVDELKKQHLTIIEELFTVKENKEGIAKDIDQLFHRIIIQLNKEPRASYDFIYDQIVSTGELLSSKIIAAYLNQQAIATKWLDVRTCIQTDNTYREANVNWKLTEEKIKEKVPPLIKEQIVITQGFLGGTIEYFTTTLGREGSDFTAAIFGYVLEAQSVSVWKDVPGILSGDPKLLDNPTKIPLLSYHEAIEMTYYGAKVIHTKTIRPLQNKLIPLIVRSFKQPNDEGTTISAIDTKPSVPIIVIKPKQALIKVTTKDFAFIGEAHLSQVYNLLAKYRVKTNLSQTAAISFSFSVDNNAIKVKPLLKSLRQFYDVDMQDELVLLTIRHYQSEAINKYTKGKEIFLEQQSPTIFQVLVKK